MLRFVFSLGIPAIDWYSRYLLPEFFQIEIFIFGLSMASNRIEKSSFRMKNQIASPISLAKSLNCDESICSEYYLVISPKYRLPNFLLMKIRYGKRLAADKPFILDQNCKFEANHNPTRRSLTKYIQSSAM